MDPGSDVINPGSSTASNNNPQPLPLPSTNNRVNIGLNPSLIPWNRQRAERGTNENLQMAVKQQNGRLLAPGQNSQNIQIPRQGDHHTQEVPHHNHNEQENKDSVIFVSGQLLGPHHLQGTTSGHQHGEGDDKDNVVYVEPTPNLVR